MGSNPEDYLLKPNKEGGGNNYFGREALEMLKTMGREQLRSYILMEKIRARRYPNLMIEGDQLVEQ